MMYDDNDLRQVLAPLPAGMQARISDAARDSETTVGRFVSEMLRRYLAEADCANLPILKPLIPVDEGKGSCLFLPANQIDAAYAAHPDGTAIGDIVLRALRHHFDPQDVRHDTLLTDIALPAATHTRLCVAAEDLGCRVEDLIARLTGDYFYDPHAADLDITVPACTTPYKKAYPLGQSIKRVAFTASNNHYKKGKPCTASDMAARAVQRYVETLDIPTALPDFTPKQLARIKKLRL